jgi:hypothetical protein
MRNINNISVKLDKECYCPVCNCKINAATALDGSGVVPNAGDVSMCVMCSAYLKYSDDLTLRELTVDELVDLPDDILYVLTKTRSIFKNISGNKNC